MECHTIMKLLIELLTRFAESLCVEQLASMQAFHNEAV